MTAAAPAAGESELTCARGHQRPSHRVAWPCCSVVGRHMRVRIPVRIVAAGHPRTPPVLVALPGSTPCPNR